MAWDGTILFYLFFNGLEWLGGGHLFCFVFSSKSRAGGEFFLMYTCAMCHSALPGNFLKRWFRQFPEGEREAVICCLLASMNPLAGYVHGHIYIFHLLSALYISSKISADIYQHEKTMISLLICTSSSRKIGYVLFHPENNF